MTLFGQPFPASAIDDCLNSRIAHAIHGRELTLSYTALLMPVPYFQHLGLRKLGELIAAASRDCLPALRNHVIAIISNRTKKQVSRIDTGRIITPVADKFTGRNWAIREFVSYTMGQCNPTPNYEPPIPVGIFAGGPYPTRICLVNFSPKSRVKGAGSEVPGKIPGGLPLDCPTSRVGPSCGQSWLAATTLTQFGGIERSLYNIHVNAPYPSIGHAGGCRKQRLGFSMPNYNTIACG